MSQHWLGIVFTAALTLGLLVSLEATASADWGFSLGFSSGGYECAPGYYYDGFCCRSIYTNSCCWDLGFCPSTPYWGDFWYGAEPFGFWSPFWPFGFGTFAFFDFDDDHGRFRHHHDRDRDRDDFAFRDGRDRTGFSDHHDPGLTTSGSGTFGGRSAGGLTPMTSHVTKDPLVLGGARDSAIARRRDQEFWQPSASPTGASTSAFAQPRVVPDTASGGAGSFTVLGQGLDARRGFVQGQAPMTWGSQTTVRTFSSPPASGGSMTGARGGSPWTIYAQPHAAPMGPTSPSFAPSGSGWSNRTRDWTQPGSLSPAPWGSRGSSSWSAPSTGWQHSVPSFSPSPSFGSAPSFHASPAPSFSGGFSGGGVGHFSGGGGFSGGAGGGGHRR